MSCATTFFQRPTIARSSITLRLPRACKITRRCWLLHSGRAVRARRFPLVDHRHPEQQPPDQHTEGNHTMRSILLSGFAVLRRHRRELHLPRQRPDDRWNRRSPMAAATRTSPMALSARPTSPRPPLAGSPYGHGGAITNGGNNRNMASGALQLCRSGHHHGRRHRLWPRHG